MLKELSEDELSDMTYKELNELWNIHKKYTKKLMEEEDTNSIILPKIGTLSFNVRYMNIQKFFTKANKDVFSIFNSKVEKIKSKEEEGIHYAHNQKPSFLKLYTAIKRKFNIKGYKRYKPLKKAIDIIEDYSNNNLNENTENNKS